MSSTQVDMAEVCAHCRLRERKSLSAWKRYHTSAEQREKLSLKSKAQYAADKERRPAKCYLRIWRNGGIEKPNPERLARYLALEVLYSAEPVVQKRSPDGRYQIKESERGEDFDSTHSASPGAP
jgi:hypothetical protein